MKKLIVFMVLISVTLVFSGCTQNRAYKSWSTDPYINDTFNESINDIAEQLFKSTRIKTADKVAITTFVDLHQLNKTSYFGRKLSESMYNELHTRGFNVVDVRGTKTIRINAEGEFFVTRDIQLLDKKRVENSYILVATYSKFGSGILLNARIIDNINGDVISTARSIIDVDACDVYENCHDIKPVQTAMKTEEKEKKVVEKKTVKKRMIGLSDAGCSYVDCPENCVDETCYNHVNYKKIVQKKVEEKPSKQYCEGTIPQTLYK